MSLNIVHLVGRVGGDPDVNYLNSGTSVCKLSLAVNRRTSKSDQPDWFKLELWDKTAEIAANYVRKGSLIGVEGKFYIDTWTDRDGRQRSTPAIRVNRLELLGSKRDNNPNMMNEYSGSGEF